MFPVNFYIRISFRQKNLIVIGTAGVEQDPYPEKIMYSNNMVLKIPFLSSFSTVVRKMNRPDLRLR